VLLFSKVFAKTYNNDAVLFLQTIQQQAPHARLVCAWGADGGYALETDDTLCYNPAYPPHQIIDTLGAGDTFNAGIIDSLCCKKNLTTALNHACQLAGKKCGQVGFKNLIY